ncbi:MAG: CerR family C-terminal domain-containing protein [Deltaproteobacteria bacterium]
MVRREDGKETRGRLLDAALAVFAESGYRNAKVADICRRAGTNLAAVNYYFGDKANLYAEAWQHAFNACASLESSDSAGLSPVEQLRLRIRNMMQDFTEKSIQGYFTRLYLMELANPTGLIQDSWRELIEPRRQELIDIIRKIMGVDTTDESVLFCEMSIINQCRALLTISRSDLRYLLGQPLSPDLIRRWADHITRFSLAGIQAAGKR